MTSVGIFEAKSRLSEIVRKAELGETTTITVRGEAKALVVPVRPIRHDEKKRAEAYERLRNPKIEGISHEQIRSWIEEGRE